MTYRKEQNILKNINMSENINKYLISSSVF
jgi:hypothetical protein